jgi:hypothetical protein
LWVHLDNIEEPDLYCWLSPSDNFLTIITPIQDSLNISCTTPMDISKAIIDADYPAYYDIPLPPLTFSLPSNFEVTPTDVSITLMNISQTALGLDNFPYKLLCFLHLNYPTILPNLYTLSLSLASILQKWKIADRILLKKPKNDIILPKSYRIISLLSTLSKTLEKIIQCQLLQNHPNVIYPHQFGYIPAYSTMDALIRFFNFAESQKSEGKFMGCALLDVEGAFDDIQSNILDDHLKNSNVQPYLWALIHNFLTDSRLALTINGH